MRVALIDTPKFVDVKNHVSTVAVPPLGLAYIAGTLENSGHNVFVIDSTGIALKQLTHYKGQIYIRGLTNQQIIERIPLAVDVIGIGCMFSYQWLILKPLLQELRKEFPKVPIIMGGEHPTGMPDQCMMESSVDFLVIGEGEETVVELLEGIQGGKAFTDISGIVFRENGKFVKNVRRSRIMEIDSITLPAWRHFPIDEYCNFNQPHGASQGRFMPMLATRGCPFQCTFCTSPQMWTTSWIARKPKLVVDEMEMYIDNYSTKDFQFEDLTAIVKRKWILDFCQEIIARKLNVTFQLPSGTRSEGVDYEVAKAMKAAGCHEFAFAPESGDPRVLVAIKKKVQLPRMFKSAREAMKAGLNVGCYFIVGFPEDDFLSIFRTYKVILKCALYGFSSMNLNAYSPQPNTESMRKLLKEGKIKEQDENYYLSLFTYSGLGAKKSYNDIFNSRVLSVFVIVGYSLFFSVYFLSRPIRAVSIFLDLFRKKSKNKVSKYLHSIVSDVFRIRSLKK